MCYNQKTTAEGKDYCDRKINLLRSNFDQLVEVCSDSPFPFPLEPCVVAFNSGCKSISSWLLNSSFIFIHIEDRNFMHTGFFFKHSLPGLKFVPIVHFLCT